MKQKKIPMRRCVGCMQSKPKKELIRITEDGEGGLAVDITGRAPGRGVYLCGDPDCLKKARKKNAITRSLGLGVSAEVLDKLSEEVAKVSESSIIK